jgi:hypothetical protein
VQRELGHDMILQVDWARRQFENVDLGELDLNRFARPAGPVIPKCATSQLFVVGQQCSSGSVTFWVPQGRTIYEAMLVKLQKRLTHHVQFTASYAFQNQNTVVAPTLDLNNYFATYGPNLPRHNVNISGLVSLPWGFQLTVNTSVISRTPVEPTLAGVSLTSAVNTFGSSTTVPIGLAVPGQPYNCFGLSCGKTELQDLVGKYNSTYGANLALPANYQFGDPKFNTDMRLSKQFTYRERFKLSVFGEVFNAFNIANLTGYSFVLGTSAFGQPTSRVGQVFGSGGPRAFQVGSRFSF